jgi:diguanylate cyclase (GGDEF)-like protein/PAS domain S-box-containing protein
MRGDPQAVLHRVRRRFSLLPYVMIAATYVMLFVVLRSGLNPRSVGALVGVMATSAIVVSRQVMAFADNAGLLERLDRRCGHVRGQARGKESVCLRRPGSSLNRPGGKSSSDPSPARSRRCGTCNQARSGGGGGGGAMGTRPTLAGLPRRHPVVTAVAVATALFAACMITRVGGDVVTRNVSNIATSLMTLVAGVACQIRAVQRPGRLRWAWIAIGLGSLSYAFGEGTWTWIETFRGGEVTLASLPDVGYLGMVPLIASGLLMVPVAGQSTANRVRSIVDGLMIAASLLLVSWILVIHPLLAAGADTVAGLYILLAYPVSDVVLVTVVLYMLAMLRRGGQDSVPLMLIGAAMLMIGISDSAYAYLAMEHSYVSGSLLDIGWFAGFGLVVLAACRPERPAEPIAAEGLADGESADGESADGVFADGEFADERQPFAILVPYAAVVSALLVSVIWYAASEQGDAVFGWCRSGLILLIVGRQLLTLLENRHLTGYLEARVAIRTAELYASEQRFRALVQQSSETVAVIDADSTIRYQSESIERIFGVTAESLIGHRVLDLMDEPTAALVRAGIETVLRVPYASTVIELPITHAQTLLVRQAEMTLTNVLHDASVNGIVLNTRDVSDAKGLQAQLVHEAFHDGLTLLASRALFRESLQESLQTCRRSDDVAVLFLDLDGFKEVNDSLGHAAGDQLLRQVADRLRESVRDGDTVARFGGDEFAVLVESIVARADAETVAQRIVAALGAPFLIDGRELHVGASVGLASAADAGDIEQLLRNADLAMYKAKAGGGSRLATYDPQMHNVLVQRLELEADLRLALERDELELHYQPTVRLATGEITGFEALVRWRHPLRGLVSPLDFIGIAEATGLIVPLGRWVLAEACRQAVEWGAGRTRGLKMAVNVSVRQFDHCDLSVLVAEVLAETGMPADQLCLEMTESVLLTDTDENLTQLLRLKQLGVTLAMDDFGTGFSSLAYLRRFPMDTLKIDRSFVSRLGGDSEDIALVRTIVRLGQSLGMSTVAEGIEDAVQLAALREMGCDYAQGYLLSRPVPAPEAGRLLTEGLPLTAPIPA